MIKQKNKQKEKTSKRSRFRGNSGLALSQITLLIVSIIATAYFIGSSIPTVEAQGGKYCILIKSSSTLERIVDISPISSPSAIKSYCDSHPEYQICEAVQCSTTTNGASGRPSLPSPSMIPINPVRVPTPPVGLSAADQDLLKRAGSASATLTPEELARVKELGGVGAVGKGFFNTARLGQITIGNFIANVGWAVAIAALTTWGLKAFGAPDELASAAGKAAGIGYFAGWAAAKSGASAAIQGGLASLGINVGAGVITGGIGILVGGIIFLVSYKKTRLDVVSFTCSPWDASLGGGDCEECNKGEIPCSEYRCRSLGQACEFVNQGDDSICVYVDRGPNPPRIDPWEETLTTGYGYSPDDAISPPDRGVKIVPENNVNGCIAPWSPLRFGVTLDKPGRCKISTQPERSFADMPNSFFSQGKKLYNHSLTLNLMSPDALGLEDGAELINNGRFDLYVRCEDANGNSNPANFAFGFCVDDGPDTQEPVIKSTSIINGNPIAHGQTSVNLNVFVNEPAECRWSHLDKSYDDMETQMSCDTNVLDVNTEGLYTCGTTLTGLKDAVDNNFYFRCKDQPHLAGTNESLRNTNQQSYKFTLKGTRPLVISSVAPNGTIKDSTDVIKVTLTARTSAGFKEGEALCEYSGVGEERFNQFFITGTHQHSQELSLPEGSYNYDIRCTDLGGNTDTKQISFTVETDTQAPIVVRAFRQENQLKIITNEEAICVYNDKPALGCTYLFEDGRPMTSLDSIRHEVAWVSDKTLYIKCSDEFGNQPTDPGACSITVRPFELR